MCAAKDLARRRARAADSGSALLLSTQNPEARANHIDQGPLRELFWIAQLAGVRHSRKNVY